MPAPLPLSITPLDLARRFAGLAEVAGAASNPQILAFLRLDQSWPGGDEVPWCSGFVNYCYWLCDLPRSKSLAARSWLKIGTTVSIANARPGFDVVVLKRGHAPQPGPDVLAAPGHVGFFLGITADRIHLFAGNHSNRVGEQSFPLADLLDIRRVR
jgi:uncharacterized protein (TIGR02594 family)